ncbi:helix-turn-helix domain-containing protein [Leuconostoc gelidum subsp. gasicomitatum]|uniref:helix-turn-helix domain-containing protein n=1 Tax=Leuconostoc gasicomitatum TaxID=115778 RepID=UPI001CC33ED7|nr:helix-turn-helix domain-containing protein [Leuconostoc gasicomitatum]MBZ5947957.1 helix-turn-helix domain-containing protein [Leuconostoc gasicomitatum]
MTTKKHNERKAQLTKYLEQLDEFNWHHPTQVSEMADSQHERDNRTYYLAQISLILFHNYQQSYMQIGQMLNISSRTARRLINDYEQDCGSLEEITEELQNGEDW